MQSFDSKRLRTPRAAVAAISLAALALLSPSLTFGSGQSEEPSELWAGVPSGGVPQSANDMRRTREEVYGRALTESQHQEILSWRVGDPLWWKDAARNDDARAKQRALFDLVRQIEGDTAIASANFRAASQTFGLDAVGVSIADSSPSVGTGFGTASKPSADFLTVTYDARKRPDLFSFEQELTKIAMAFGEKTVEEQTIFFMRVFHGSEQCQGGSGEFGTSASTDSSCGLGKWELLGLQTTFTQVLADTTSFFRTDFANRIDPMMESLIVQHQSGFGAIDLGTYLDYDRQIFDMESASYRASSARCLDALPASLVDSFVETVIDGIRGSQIQHPFPTQNRLLEEVAGAQTVIENL